MNSKISFFGDMLVDLVRCGDVFLPQPGGSIFNTAIAAANNGRIVNFISQIGNDYWGRYLTDFCRQHHINTDHIYQSENIKTSLAFAITDEAGNAVYDFYKSQERHDFDPDILSGSAMFHYGSTFSLMNVNEDNITRFLTFCREHHILTSYDPNCRPGSDAALIRKWCGLSDIVKLSNEDAAYIYPDLTEEQAANELLNGRTRLVVMTLGHNGAKSFCGTRSGYAECHHSDKPIRNTIGAGDNFTAGMIEYLVENDILRTDALSSMTAEQLTQLCYAGNDAALRHLTR